jgi:nitrate reductase gamma subunit
VGVALITVVLAPGGLLLLFPRIIMFMVDLISVNQDGLAYIFLTM